MILFVNLMRIELLYTYLMIYLTNQNVQEVFSCHSSIFSNLESNDRCHISSVECRYLFRNMSAGGQESCCGSANPDGRPSDLWAA